MRRARNCRPCAAGLQAKTVTAAVAPAVHHAAIPRALRPPAIAVRLAANRSVHVPAVKATVLAIRTAASAANRVVLPVATATARPVAGPRPVVVRRVRAKVRAIVCTAIKPPPPGVRKARVVPARKVLLARKVRLAIARRVPAGRRAKVAIVRQVVPGRKVTADPLADARRAVAAIVRATAERRFGVTRQGG